jgi:8-oxo-dGTP pyrophosphatase MutT (NUDIX family)
MKMTVYREMAGSVILDPQGRFLIQKRDDKPTIPYAGRLALFGGAREGDESLLQCAVREFREELTYSVPVHRFEHFLSYEGPDLDVEGCTSRVEAFIVRDVPVNAVTVTEGSLVIANRHELLGLRDRFVPLPWMILETFLKSR